MPKKYNCLIFSDFEIPNYDRPYRGILFMEWANSKKYDFFVISPFTKTKFKNNNDNVSLFYYKNQHKIKHNQYNIFFRISNLWKLYLSILNFRKKDKKIDIIYAGTTYLLLFAGMFKKNNTKVIANVCDFYSDLYSGYKMPLEKFFKYPILSLETHALSFADVITVDTYAQKDLLVYKYKINPNKCVVLPNGLIVDKFPYLDTKDDSVMKNYNFKKKDWIFFYGGDISRDDGVEMIIQFAYENKSQENFKFLIIGKGNPAYINKLQDLIHEYNLVEKVIIDSFKPIDELYKYISVADICLAPFKITNTTNVTEVAKIISYMLGGKKVLSTRAEGVFSLYKDEILYFEDSNYNDFKAKLIEMTYKPLSKEEKFKIRKHAEKFDFRKIIEIEYEIVDRLLTQNLYFEDLNFEIES